MTTRRSETPWKPTKAQLAAAVNGGIPDVIARDLRVLFVGINPGLYSAAVGHHFARPGNRFWPALFAGGFTDRLLSPFEEAEFLARGYGITNVVARASAAASELRDEELHAGAVILERKIRRYQPKMVALLGVTSYRIAFKVDEVKVGLQPTHRIGKSRVWVLPNPSGLNAHYQAPELGRLFRELHRAASE